MRHPSSISQPFDGNDDDSTSGSETFGETSTVISRPSLLADIRLDLRRMQSPWKVNDAALRPIPPFYPPLCPRCSVIITDSPPSVVGSRISDSLMKRSISVEYDEEAQTATCMTIDRVHFVVSLFRGNLTIAPSNPESLDQPPDLSHAVIVEVMRQRGSNISFHHHCRAILNAAIGYSTGVDSRKPITTSSLEFPRLMEKPKDLQLRHRCLGEKEDTDLDTKKITPKRSMAFLHMQKGGDDVLVRQTLEHSLSWLKKDRLEAQKLGMESLVNLTDVYSSGENVAIMASMIILGLPSMSTSKGDVFTGDYNESISNESSYYLLSLIRDRVFPGDSAEAILDWSLASSSNCFTSESALKNNYGSILDTSSTRGSYCMNDAHHGGQMRSMALRVFANILSVLSTSCQPIWLTTIMNQGSWFSSRPLVQALVEDLLGANRFPGAVSGTRLASVHEATLSTRCLGLLSLYCPSTVGQWVAGRSSSSPTMKVLQQNLNCRHDALVKETEKTLAILSTI